MPRKKSTVIELAVYKPHEMGYVLINGKCEFQGNYWDFHSGCHGSTIAGYDLSNKWDRGMASLANALKSAMEADGVKVSVKNKTLTDKEYVNLGGYP